MSVLTTTDYELRIVEPTRSSTFGAVIGDITDNPLVQYHPNSTDTLEYVKTKFGPLAHSFTAEQFSDHPDRILEVTRRTGSFHDEGASAKQSVRNIIYASEIDPGCESIRVLDDLAEYSDTDPVISVSIPQVLTETSGTYFVLRQMVITQTH